MLFNSIDFAVFLPLTFGIYWFLTNKNLKLQNIFILTASYVFYGWWDYRFLSLIIFSTITDFFVGKMLSKEESKHKRKLLLWLSIGVNLGLLGFFKYYNFFLENFIVAFSFFGKSISPQSLNIILPVGISFYTFQTLSYTIDVYRRKMKPTSDLISFASFVSFFPQLVAGPIERAKNLLPQFNKARYFQYDQAIIGMRLILWGLFKKIVIADNCAEYVNLIFNNSEQFSGSTLLLGAVLFAFQIYGDFSGYSDIAIGTARLFGFRLMKNFALPYFSRDMAEFWRRWHISLSGWFRDYLYIPLGGSRGRTVSKIRNIFIIFLVSGFWHGANWTFVAWGAINAMYFLPLLLGRRNRKNLGVVAEHSTLPSFKELVSIIITFGLTVFAWIFFRADSISHAFSVVAEIFSMSLFVIPQYIFEIKMLIIISFIGLLIIIEWAGRKEAYVLAVLDFYDSKVFKWSVYYCLCMIILLFSGTQQEFIYFQF